MLISRSFILRVSKGRKTNQESMPKKKRKIYPPKGRIIGGEGNGGRWENKGLPSVGKKIVFPPPGGGCGKEQGWKRGGRGQKPQG